MPLNKKNMLMIFFPFFICGNVTHADDGFWKDTKTGLMWSRCSIGQKWNGNTCTGKPILLKYSDAQEYIENFINSGNSLYKNWRVPTIKELADIRYCSKNWKVDSYTTSRLTPEGKKNFQVNSEPLKAQLYNGYGYVPLQCSSDSSSPTIDTKIFPNTPSKWYLSSTQCPSGEMFVVSFTEGFVNGCSARYVEHYVRAVRTIE